MKKVFTTILSALLIVSATGCSDKDTKSVVDNNTEKVSQPKIVKVEGDRIVYYDFDSLEESADLVVTGKFKNDTTQNLKYEYSSEFGKDILVNTVSSNKIEIIKVLKGEADEQTLKVSQRYGFIEESNELVTFSEMTSMEKGDEWIFFLYYDDENDTYWCSGDYSGRYPLPDSSLNTICKEINEIRNERDNFLDGKQSDNNTPTSSSDYLYTAADGSEYVFTNAEDIKKMTSFDDDISLAAEKITADKFGVYDEELINIELYCDILDEYDFT